MGDKYSHINKWIPKSKSGRLALGLIFFWMLIAIFSPILEGVVGYRFDQLNPESGLLSPLSPGANGLHLLGTDQLGRDLAAGMIHGARLAFLISFLTITLSLILGLFIGLAIGFYGDRGIKRNAIQVFIWVICIVLGLYYFISVLKEGMNTYNLIPLVIVGLLLIITEKVISQLTFRKYSMPIDLTVQRLFELRESLPGIFIILSVASIFATSSIYSLAFIMAILYWMTFARHARAETQAIKEEDYIISARSSGVSDFRLMMSHILPNALPTILVIVAFSFSSVILLESSLSFLGIGIPLEEVSWGKILASARKSPRAWWLALFPGLAIFLVLYSFNTLGDYYSQFQRRNDR